MLPLKAAKVLVVEGVEDDPLMRARMDRLLPGFGTDDVRTVGDEELNAEMARLRDHRPRHGGAGEVDPVVILNRGRFDDDEAERQRRAEAYPALGSDLYAGYDMFHWRPSGCEDYRRKTGLVCQPAWQLHTIMGCHFRCDYCNLGWLVNVMMNVEEFVGRLDGWLERCPEQTLFQYDNNTDTVCFEPEYGGTKLLIDYFAGREAQALELYVGKSDHVDFLLDYDHRGHTVCCWSLSGPTQSVAFEPASAPMDRRIESMRRCADAGYPVRVRFSPIIPVKGWREENRQMVEDLFAAVSPDVITIETIRYVDYEAMRKLFDVSLLDEEFVRLMEAAQDEPYEWGSEVPDDYRTMVYDFVIAELERVSPETPYAFCREKRTVWERFGEDFARHGQHPDDYLCNCGPLSAPATAGAGADRRA
jgi:DNA repair photolyase